MTMYFSHHYYFYAVTVRSYINNYAKTAKNMRILKV